MAIMLTRKAKLLTKVEVLNGIYKRIEELKLRHKKHEL